VVKITGRSKDEMSPSLTYIMMHDVPIQIQALAHSALKVLRILPDNYPERRYYERVDCTVRIATANRRRGRSA
jgi:hypothetical protein